MADQGAVLFLTVCSYAKAPGGYSGPYDWDESIFATLEEAKRAQLIDRLYTTRNSLRTQLKESRRWWRNALPLRALNEKIRGGPDFKKGNGYGTGKYLPAIERYDGSFYRALGDADERRSLFTKFSMMHRHLLIVSGLYGLVRPFEPIQSYDLHVPDHDSVSHDSVSRAWKSGDLATDILLTYISQERIARVFQLIADDHYIDLFDWKRVSQSVRGNLFHWECDYYMGPGQLRYFGLEVGEYGEKVYFRKERRPSHPPLLATRLDMVGRMRRNIIAYLNKIDAKAGEKSLGERITRMANEKRLDSDVAKAMQAFCRLRNQVEYEDRYANHVERRQLDNTQWRFLVETYQHIRELTCGFQPVEEMERIDLTLVPLP